MPFALDGKDADARGQRGLIESRSSRAEDDSDSLMSGGLSDDEDNDEEGAEDEEIERRDTNFNIFKGDLKMPPYEHAKRQLSQLLGKVHVLQPDSWHD